MLWPNLEFDPQETLASYADRLSMFHTGRGMERLLRDNGINTGHFVSGRTDAVSMFAEATGHHAEALLQNAIRVYQRGGEFRGEAISKAFLQPQARRCCPMCLKEDGGSSDWWFRLIWGFRHVQRCDRHDVWLATTGNPSANCLRVALNEAPEVAPADAAEVESGNRMFEAATTIPMVKAFETAIPLRDVPYYLGASKRQFETLHREAVFQPLVPCSGRGSVRSVVFGWSHLDDMLE